MPVHDPQFWLATAIFVIALGWLLRGVLPGVSRRQAARGRRRKVSLTVGGKPLKK